MTRDTPDQATTGQRLVAAAETVDKIGALAAAIGAPLPLVRVNAGMVEEGGCPRFNWAKANVTYTVKRRPWRRREPLSDFLLEPLFKVLDAVEIDGCSVEEALRSVKWEARLGEPEKRWIRNAAAAYPDLRATNLDRVSGWWVVRGAAGRQTRELYTWGRAYASADGGHRLLVLPAMGTASRREVAKQRISVAAYTTAFGRLAAWPDPWPAPFHIAEEEFVAPSRVTVRQVGLLDGSMRDLFDGVPEDAKALYNEVGRPAATAITASTQMGPGHDCGGCRLLDECDSVPRARGLLGVVDREAPLRELSATTLRYHRDCPQQARLFDLNLSTAWEEPSAIRVGRAIDAVLNAAHSGERTAACTRVELHALLGDQVGLTSEERLLCSKRLEGHEQTCPWVANAPIDGARPQASVVAFDPDGSAVIHATPDLLFREDHAVVWRETTSSERPPWSSRNLLDTRKSVQLALAVLLLNYGALGAEAGRIEVEYLTDQGPDLRLLDPTDPEVVATAAEIIRPLAAQWRQDQHFRATPGDVCQSCAYSSCCPASARTEVA